jgi:hypothetical protein
MDSEQKSHNYYLPKSVQNPFWQIKIKICGPGGQRITSAPLLRYRGKSMDWGICNKNRFEKKHPD